LTVPDLQGDRPDPENLPPEGLIFTIAVLAAHVAVEAWSKLV
jgi:hypothetical protein